MPMESSIDHASLIHLALAPDTHPIQSYQALLIYYNQTDLTKAEDRLNAIAGFFSRLEFRMKCRFFQGLPTAMLDAALLFTMLPSFGCATVHRRGVFPSYSWAGWSSRPDWTNIPDFRIGLVYPEESEDSIANNKWLEKRTWIIWYSRDIDGVLRPVTSDRDHESLRNEPSTILGYRGRC